MGGGQSTPLQECLNQVCENRPWGSCVAYPDSVGYDLLWAPKFNTDLNISPAAVFVPNDSGDVVRALRCAEKLGLTVQAKSGGHSYGNFGYGTGDTITIDLKNLKSFDVDEETWQVKVGGGTQLGSLDKSLYEGGVRAIPHGTCPMVGVGGHATVGGLGPNSRMWGAMLDNLVEVEIVTADGGIQRANETHNEDLFWAIRGAGASFGVITEFVFKTYSAPASTVEETYSYVFANQKEMARVYRTWQNDIAAKKLDNRFSSQFIAQPFGAILTSTFYGTEEEYKATGIADKFPTGGLLSHKVYGWLDGAKHHADLSALVHAHVSAAFDSKSMAFREDEFLSDESIDELFTFIDQQKWNTLVWFIIWNTEGGVVNDVPMDGTAYSHRDKEMMYQSYAVGIPKVTDGIRNFVNGVDEAIRKGVPTANATYAGYVDPDLDRDTANSFYWGSNVDRLREIKAKWDPKNLFRNPQSVSPEGWEDPAKRMARMKI